MQALILRWLMVGVLGVALVACQDPRANQPTATAPPPTETPDPNLPPTPAYAPDGRLLARTTVRSDITEDTTFNLEGSPYMLLLPVGVREGVTLTIEPGVLVYAETDVALNVFGTLIANGASFESWNLAAGWQGIGFYGRTQSIFSNNRLSGARNGILCENSFPLLTGNEIGPVRVNGIICLVQLPPPENWSISGNRVYDAGQSGIQIWVDPNMITSNPFQITGNTIERSGHSGIGVGSTRWLQGGWAHVNLQLTLSNNQIQAVGSHGILLQYVSGILVQRNVVASSALSGLSLSPTHTTQVSYNWFSANNVSGIRVEEVRGQPLRDLLIQCNLVDQNLRHGIEVIRAQVLLAESALTLIGNDLANNGEFALYMSGAPVDLDAPNNWWGTGDANLVESLIWDQLDDVKLGRVVAGPVRSGPPLREPGSCP